MKTASPHSPVELTALLQQLEALPPVEVPQPWDQELQQRIQSRTEQQRQKLTLQNWSILTVLWVVLNVGCLWALQHQQRPSDALRTQQLKQVAQAFLMSNQP